MGPRKIGRDYDRWDRASTHFEPASGAISNAPTAGRHRGNAQSYRARHSDRNARDHVVRTGVASPPVGCVGARRFSRLSGGRVARTESRGIGGTPRRAPLRRPLRSVPRLTIVHRSSRSYVSSPPTRPWASRPSVAPVTTASRRFAGVGSRPGLAARWLDPHARGPLRPGATYGGIRLPASRIGRSAGTPRRPRSARGRPRLSIGVFAGPLSDRTITRNRCRRPVSGVRLRCLIARRRFLC